jgi:hypothetical protein
MRFIRGQFKFQVSGFKRQVFRVGQASSLSASNSSQAGSLTHSFNPATSGKAFQLQN